MNKVFPLAAGLAGLYLCFLTASHYWDGVLFSLYIEKVAEGALPRASLFHPNHLLYSGFGYLAYDLLRLLHLPVRSITALQLMNVLGSVICSVILFRLCGRLFRSPGVALSCTLLFALGATWWRFSTDANSYIISVTLLLAAVALALTNVRLIASAGLCLATAMLFHQLAVFGYVPILVAIWIRPGTHRERLRRATTFVAATAACVAGAYYMAYRFTHVGPTTQTFFGWITSVSNDTKTTSSVGQLLAGNASSYLKLFGGGKLGLVQDFLSPPVVLALLFSVACVTAAVATAFRKRGAGPATSHVSDRHARTVFWSWLAVYLAFLSWFEPGNAFYKLFVWPPMVLLIGFFIDDRGDRWKAAFCWVVLALANWNFAGFIYPHSRVEADPVLSLATRMDKELPQSATVYYKALSPDDWYLEYFAPGRKWEPLPPANKIPRGKPAAPVCFETTALPYVQAETDPALRWTLVNSQHNIRLECVKPEID